MTREQFGYIIKPLIKAFGENHFSDDKISLLYAKLVILNQEQMEEVVQDCLLEFTFAPSLAKVIVVAKPHLDKAYDIIKKEKLAEAEKNPCHMCDNSGWVETVDISSSMRYIAAFRCVCVVGKDMVGPKETTFWSEAKFGHRFLASYKTKHSLGGGTRTEHIEQGDKIHYERLGKAMGIECSIHDKESLEGVKSAFYELSHKERLNALAAVMSG